MRYRIYPLAKLIEEFGEGQVSSMLSSFTCSKDRDREMYLREKAVMMEKKAMSRRTWPSRTRGRSWDTSPSA